MPIYEFVCQDCRKRFSVLCAIADRPDHPACEHCGRPNTERLVSRFRTLRSEEAIMESLADPSALSGLDENDPATIARWAKKMAREMGEDMGDEIESLAEEEMQKAVRGGAAADGEGPGGDAPPSATSTDDLD